MLKKIVNSIQQKWHQIQIDTILHKYQFRNSSNNLEYNILHVTNRKALSHIIKWHQKIRKKESS